MDNSLATVTLTAAGPPWRQVLTPWGQWIYLARRWDLLKQFALRDVALRYRGSYLGAQWAFLNPLLLLAVYTFVFGVIFKLRWTGEQTTSRLEFATTVFAGLVSFSIFADSINRASAVIVGLPNYVKKVVFPLEVLPLSLVMSALVQAGLSTLVLLVAVGVQRHGLPWTVLLAPVALAPIVLIASGFSLLVSSLGVFVRDVSNTVSLVTSILFFMTPIFYPSTAIPEKFRWALYFNPLAPGVEAFRAVIVKGELALTMPFWISFGFGLAVCYVGFLWFFRIKKAFADVI